MISAVDITEIDSTSAQHAFLKNNQTLTINDLLTDLPSDDEEDEDFVLNEDEIEEEEEEQEEGVVVEKETPDDHDDEIPAGEISDIVSVSLALQNQQVLRSGQGKSAYRTTTILDDLEDDDEDDEEYSEAKEEQFDPMDEEEEDDDVEEDDVEEYDVDHEEVKDIIRGHPYTLGSKESPFLKSSKVLRDGKEIPSSMEMNDLATKIQNMLSDD